MKKKEVLSIKGLCKTYTSGRNTVEALKNINLSLYRGEMLAIMGSSGSGKTTLLNIIGALDSPTSGSMMMEDVKIDNYHIEPFATEYRSNNIGFIFQTFNLLKDLNVEENIALPLMLKGEDTNSITEKTNKQLEMVGLKSWRKHRPLQLSGGQQQRVAIARALVTTPPILLADEPTGNLDYNTSLEILDIIVQAKEKLNQSIILVTHDPMVASYADRILFFHDGRIVDQFVKDKGKGDINLILEKFRKILEAKHD